MDKLNSISKFFAIVLTLLTLFITPVYADWQGPTEIITGEWGGGDSQFGITYQDTSDFIPNFNVTTDLKIVIRDGTNSRVKVYDSSGGAVIIVPYREKLSYKELTTADSYGFTGDFVGYGDGGANYFYRADQKVYINFSPTGQLIMTYTTRPLKLGKIKEVGKTKRGFEIIITYPDKIYTLILSGPYQKYIRDVNDNINAIAGREIRKFNFCGKELGGLILPANQRRVIQPAGGGFEEISEVLEEYGPPVIAPNGDVYTWKRTPDSYSILKWTWVDSPKEQKTEKNKK